MNFSEALERIKLGDKLKRSGWNGKDQFVYLVEGSKFIASKKPLADIYFVGTEITYRPHIDMKYQDGTCGVWSPMMGDLIAEDWEVVE